jgi:hypothetical protein
LSVNPGADKQQEMVTDIALFLKGCSGLKLLATSDRSMTILQAADGKTLDIHIADLEKVLFRSDTEGAPFIQVNFSSGRKILLTSALVGFKPAALSGLDMSKLPRVVTTPDLLSIYESIQDSMHDLDAAPSEIHILKRILEAVLAGGEAVGFDLSIERSWMRRIPSNFTTTAA